MELWHVLNRGVEGRDLFLDSQDYARFVHNLYEFNDSKPAGNLYRLFDTSGKRDFVSPSWRGHRDVLVDVHGWVLMRNHYHLVISERQEGGLSLFLRKLNVGYAKYFNERYGRSGTLFQGRTKKIQISTNAHFLYILHYVHLNPLDYLRGAEDWRVRSKGHIHDLRDALSYLKTYRWSSYLDYRGTRNFPSIVTTSLFSGAKDDYSASLMAYLSDAESGGATRELDLE